jgi:hypothetical protein
VLPGALRGICFGGKLKSRAIRSVAIFPMLDQGVSKKSFLDSLMPRRVKLGRLDSFTSMLILILHNLADDRDDYPGNIAI